MDASTISSPAMRTFDPAGCEPREIYKLMTGIIVPRQIIARPFAPPKKDARFTLDDGIILL